MTITSEDRVGQIAAEFPAATRVFHRYGIDFCCGGGKPLSSVCQTKSIDVDNVLEEISRELAGRDTDMRWDRAQLEDVVDHIVLTYHEGLREELPRLEGMLRKVSRVHGHVDPTMFEELLAVFLGLKTELDRHMDEEERILFPLIRDGDCASADGNVADLEHDHEAAGVALRNIRALTKNYEAPDYACKTWRALWFGLGELEIALHEHIHLENNILFPRALAG